MMTSDQRTAFLHARAQGLGGSDCASLLQPDIEVKYGCARRLGLNKARVEPDFPREESGPMLLGQILEPHLCSIFEKLSGRKVREVGRQTHPDHPELGGHVDRMQSDPIKGEGPVEAKALGTRIFYQVKREGILVDYSCQLQFYITVVNSSYGSFVVGNRDNLAVIYWDVDRNEQMCEAIVRKGVEFWVNVGNLDKLSPKLEPDDPRCQRCEYRIRCHANTLLPAADGDLIPIADELQPLAAEYLERKDEFDRAEESLQETKEIVATILGQRSAVQVHVEGKLRPIYYREQAGRPAYGEAVKAMAVPYGQMRDHLIQIETLIKNNEPDLEHRIAGLVAGASLIAPASSHVKKGKPFRALMMQYLAPRKDDDAG